MKNIQMTGNPTQQVLVYDVTIKKVKSSWRISYKYNGEVGSFLITSLTKAKQWCDERGLSYTIETA